MSETHDIPDGIRTLRLSAVGELGEAIGAFMKPEVREKMGARGLYLFSTQSVRLPPRPDVDTYSSWNPEPEPAVVPPYTASWHQFTQYQHMITGMNNQKFHFWPTVEYENSPRASVSLTFTLHPTDRQYTAIVREPFYHSNDINPDATTVILRKNISRTHLDTRTKVGDAIVGLRHLMGADNLDASDYAPRDRVLAVMPTLIDPFESLRVRREIEARISERKAMLKDTG
jgi:hypothetical protein